MDHADGPLVDVLFPVARGVDVADLVELRRLVVVILVGLLIRLVSINFQVEVLCPKG